MDAATFLENFGTIADSPGGIASLRSLILDLAVRGKLVEQMEKDGKVSAFIDSFPQNITSSKATSPARYPVPVSWEWRTIAEVSFNRDSERIPIPRAERETRQGPYDYYGASGVIDSIDEYLFSKPTLLVGEDGANLVNRKTPIAFIARGRYWVNNHAHVIDSVAEGALEYLAIAINQMDLRPFLTGTAQPKLNQAKLNRLTIPVPPLAEQKRIVAKVDELMSLCDELEAQQKLRDTLRTQARSSAIDAISTASSPEELSAAWERIHNNWNTIADSPGGIASLRSLILDLAVRGKLVDQDGSEESPSFPEADGPFAIPANWKWCALGEVGEYGGRGQVGPAAIGSQDWVLDLEDIEKTSSRLIQRVSAGTRSTTSNKTRFNPGDVLYGKLRPYLDKVLVADISGFCTTEIVPITPRKGVLPSWLRLSLKTPTFLSYVGEKSYGMKMPRLGTKDAKASVHAIPPLAEQKRIVAKVDELMSLCDELELALVERRDLSVRLARSGTRLAGSEAK